MDFFLQLPSNQNAKESRNLLKLFKYNMICNLYIRTEVGSTYTVYNYKPTKKRYLHAVPALFKCNWGLMANKKLLSHTSS